jgi:hypothetical protein
VLATVAVALSGFAAATPASAYVRDFYTFQKESPFDSSLYKGFTNTSLRCPREASQAGQITLGAGARFGDHPNVGLSRLTPTRGIENGAYVAAQEVDPEAAGWNLTGQIFCATETNVRPAASPARSMYLKDVYTTGLFPIPNSQSPKVGQVLCGGGSAAIGGGFRIQNPVSRQEPGAAARMVTLFQNGVRVAAHEVEPTSLSWRLAPYAICANVTQAPSTAKYVHTLSQPQGVRPATSAAAKDIHVGCPRDSVIIGGGAQAFQGTAASFGPPPRNVMLVASFPTTPRETREPNSVFRPNEWYARAVEQQPIAQNWGLVVRAVCAGVSGP